MTMQGSIKATMGPVEWLMLVTFAFLWGTSYIFTTLALYHMPVMTFTFWRAVMAAAILYAICRASGLRLPVSRRLWTMMTVMSLLNMALPNLLLFWAQKTVPPGFASVMIASTPFFTVLMAQFLTADEKLTAGKLIGVISGFLGVGAMLGLSLLATAGTDAVAEIALLCAAVLLALAGIYGRRMRGTGVDMTILATMQTIIGVGLFAPVYLIADHPWEAPLPSLAGFGWIAAASVGGAALSPLLYFRLLSRAGATNVVLTTFLAPVFSIAASALFLGERLEARHLAGMALIGLGLAAIDGRPWAALRGLLRPARNTR